MTDAAPTRRPFVRVMRERDPREPHRASTPLELLYDLTFVVAIAAAAEGLAHAIEESHVAHGLLAFAIVFFSIWWAWMNFTWFASAFDTDDVPYRLLTMLQMGGVLVLAAGVPAAMADFDLTTITVGYVLMRLPMVGQWLRAAAADPLVAPAARSYAAAILVVQVLWVLRLALPTPWSYIVLPLLGAAELSTPYFAERRHPQWRIRAQGTSWHPHHVAERYALFTIIVLGECVLAATVSIRSAIDTGGVTSATVVLAAAGLALLCAVWWLYFLGDAGELLTQLPGRSFVWGYGHLVVFMSVAAIGAGLEVAAQSLTTTTPIGGMAVALAVAVPTSVAVLSIWLLQFRIGLPDPLGAPAVIGCVVVMTVVAVAVSGWSEPAAVMAVAVGIALLVARGVRRQHQLPE